MMNSAGGHRAVEFPSLGSKDLRKVVLACPVKGGDGMVSSAQASTVRAAYAVCVH